MRHRYRLLAAASLLPACSTAPAAYRGRANPSATPQADAGPDATAAPLSAATSAGPATSSAGAVEPERAPAGPTTTVTVTLPHATTTTTLVLPERADDHLSDAEWWAGQPGACGRTLPPCWVMIRESGGNIHAVNPTSGAAGKWQVIPSTWQGYGGYRSAADAPESVQDAFAERLWNGGRGCAHWSAC